MNLEQVNNVTTLEITPDEALELIQKLAEQIGRHQKYGNSLVISKGCLLKTDRYFAHVLRISVQT